MALTDVECVYGSARFHGVAKKTGLQAHVGSEITMANGSRCTVLVKSRTGYRNLCRLITRIELRSGRKFAEGLLCITGGDQVPLARAMARTTLDSMVIVYVELQRHLNRDEEFGTRRL